METDYKVRLEIFEGPLDLLLYLIKQDEIDIYEISLERITSQYLEYLQAFKELNIDIAGEFIVMAANLIYLKSRSLLPVDQQPPDEDASEDDPRWDLIRQLIEYKKFKEAASLLHMRQLEQERMFARSGTGLEVIATVPLPLGEVGIFQLINAFQTVLKRVEAREDLREIFGEHFTVSDKIDSILQRVAAGLPLKFSELFAEMASRVEIVVTFLALLELIRLKQISVTQANPFDEIEIASVSRLAGYAANSDCRLRLRWPGGRRSFSWARMEGRGMDGVHSIGRATCRQTIPGSCRGHHQYCRGIGARRGVRCHRALRKFRGGDAGKYRRLYLEGARNLLGAFPRARLIFTSSTSVYAQQDGVLVDETSPADPVHEKGRVLREAEELVLARHGIVARLAGIYGPGRSFLLRTFLAGEAVLDRNDDRVINQAHRDDIVVSTVSPG